jgi:hypothetical protein
MTQTPSPEILTRLRTISSAPLDDAAFSAWLELKDVVPFLKHNARGDEFILYAGVPYSFMHAVLVPASLVDPPDVDDLMSWNCSPSSSWGITQTFNPSTVFISPPLDHSGSNTLDQGKQLLFARHFEGLLGKKNYLEIAQDFIHVSDLHFVAERHAYCRLDRRGDLEDGVRIIEVAGHGDVFGGSVVTVTRDLLDEYMALTDSVAIVMFDFTRFRMAGFGGWSNALPERAANDDIHYRFVIQPGYASYMRGFQVVRPRLTREDVARRLSRPARDEKDYASFIAQDWKNGVIREISCAPGHTANYFTKSDLPFETSPAFFRPDVLLKYKADSDKYRLGDGSISCRGAWHLETYDINEAGQVHTYIVYLSRLPYEEQLHWKAYNEAPKAPISKRALKADFEGSWDLDYDALDSLKGIARELSRRMVPWWTLRSEKLLDQLNYPVTLSADEWANELLHLDQLVVEGLEEKWLREHAHSLGRKPDPTLRSLKLLEECLVGKGFEVEHARQLTIPLHEAHNLRSKLKGHASGEEATEMKRDLLRTHQTYSQHFRDLCRRCDESMRTIHDAFDRGR